MIQVNKIGRAPVHKMAVGRCGGGNCSVPSLYIVHIWQSQS